MDVLALPVAGLVVVAQQVLHRRVRVAGPVDDVQDHRVSDGETGGQRLGLGVAQPLEGRLAVADEALRRLLLDDLAARLRVVARLGQGLLVLDDVLGGLHDDPPGRVEPGPTRPPGDLVELARLQQPGLLAVELRQRREQHGADRHVDADAQRVGAADDLEQASLGERLDEAAVLGQHAGVVHADAVPDQPGQRLAEAAREPEVADQRGDGLPSPACVHTFTLISAWACSSACGLGEVDHVDGCLVGGEQFLQRLVQRLDQVGEDERQRAARRS